MNTFFSFLQKLSLETPQTLLDPSLLIKNKQSSLPIDPEIHSLFPLLRGDSYTFSKGNKQTLKSLHVGVVFSGGQASGGHNVIIGLLEALVEMNPHSSLIGFLGGPSGLIDNKTKHLTKEGIAAYRNTGGFDLLGSGRTKIETPEQFEKTLTTLKSHQVDALVVIGGDDSNTNAALLAHYFLEKKYPCQVIGVPKTIDGDLKNAHIEVSFGFDTAAKVYAELVGNLERDCLSAKKYTHFIKIMGRSASHLVLEAAMLCRPNMALISEEVKAKKWSLNTLVSKLADLIENRSKNGKNYGTILIPEGLVESIEEMGWMIQELNELLVQASPQEAIEKLKKNSKELFSSLPSMIQEQLLTERDPHGNVNVSIIETEKLFIEMVKKELKQRSFKGKFAPISHFFGYEGRCAYPSYFDMVYTNALGRGAAVLIAQGLTGMMVSMRHLDQVPKQWTLEAVPLIAMMHLEIRKGEKKPVIAKALVDLNQKRFKAYMQIRGEDEFQDGYQFPGPFQYSGPQELLYQPPLLIQDH